MNFNIFVFYPTFSGQSVQSTFKKSEIQPPATAGGTDIDFLALILDT
jgi:hypothetical protein